MTVRSYKQIFEKFATLFPELAKGVGTWKGIRFSDRHIRIKMANDTDLDFYYHSDKTWWLTCNGV